MADTLEELEREQLAAGRAMLAALKTVLTNPHATLEMSGIHAEDA